MPTVRMHDVPEDRMKRIQEFISWIGGGPLADALMSLVLAYEQRGLKIEHLQEKITRIAEADPIGPDR